MLLPGWQNEPKRVYLLVRSLQLAGLDFFKGVLLGLRSFLATENPLKMMKDAFYFTSKALFVLKIFNFLS